jgi:hypothetical protein
MAWLDSGSASNHEFRVRQARETWGQPAFVLQHL